MTTVKLQVEYVRKEIIEYELEDLQTSGIRQVGTNDQTIMARVRRQMLIAAQQNKRNGESPRIIDWHTYECPICNDLACLPAGEFCECDRGQAAKLHAKELGIT